MTPELFAEQYGLDPNKKTFPVESWNPPISGDMDLVIQKDGRWIHEGGEIKREGLVRLFASILKKEGDDYFLVTPVEKWRIRVEDTPLHVISVSELTRAGRVGVTALLTDGSFRDIDASARLSLERLEGVDVPVIDVRSGLRARFLRNAYYTLVSLAQEVDVGLSIETFGVKLQLSVDE